MRPLPHGLHVPFAVRPPSDVRVISSGAVQLSMPPVPTAGRSRLEHLLEELLAATERGDIPGALRLSDAARRIAPADPTTAVVHARLLMRLGHFERALELLAQYKSPNAMAVLAEVLCHMGRHLEASSLCGLLLAKHSVDCVESLESALTLLCLGPGTSPGWIGVDSSLCLVGKAPAGSRLEWEQAATRGRITLPVSGTDRFVPIRLPLCASSGAPVIVYGDDGPLLGSPLARPPEFDCQGWVAPDEAGLRGEVRLAWAPGRPVTLIVGMPGEQERRVQVAPDPSGMIDAPFSIALTELTPHAVEVSALLPDGRRLPLLGSPVARPAPDAIHPVTDRPERARPDRSAAPLPTRLVDIVVPVFAGREETHRCIASVLATVGPDQAELVVVNDASPDADLCVDLERLAKSGRITLLVNSTNLGFPGTANRGMQVHPDRDVVLLNSDCEVFDDWLARLQAAAYAGHDIASVTPLGENASIASYPSRSDSDSDSWPASSIDAIAREVNVGNLVEVPVGVGFCMYLRRDGLDDTGGFDERHYGRGYGEENDFCLRARRRGWRHLVATDIYVRHRGGCSFGAQAGPLRARHGRVLNALHPGYDALIARHIAQDPLRLARRAIDLRRLQDLACKPVLLVTHALGGGVQRYVDRRATRLAARGHSVLLLKPASTSKAAARLLLRERALEDLCFEIPADAGLLESTLRALKLAGVELHHFLNLPMTLLEQIVDLGVPYDVYLHDYSWICPRLTLLGADGRYCGEPEIAACETCVRENGSAMPPSMKVADLRARSACLLGHARSVMCASQDVRARFQRHFPALPIKIIRWEDDSSPLPRRAPAPVRRRVRVAVIGAISVQKGHQVLLQCARAAAAGDLPLEFVLIGYSCDDDALLRTGRVFITGPYQESEVGALLQREQCNVALFPSVTPETWCCTLTYALSDGMPIVAFELGAVAERLRGSGSARLLPLTTLAEQINQCLIQCVAPIPGDPGEPDSSHRPGAVEGKYMEGIPIVSDSADPAQTQSPIEHAASAQMLILPAGVYSFSIQCGAPTGMHGEAMSLPALHIGLAPVRPQAQVEFFAGPGTLDRWLAYADDRVTARITGGSAALLLTSLREPEQPALSIEIRRIDVATAPDAPGAVPLQIMAHVRQLGDLHFCTGAVAPLGSGLWIEALIVRAMDAEGAGLVEYRGATADGFESPWLTEPLLCGSRGRGTPLVAFALRPRVAFAERYACSYTGRFGSGRNVGPLRDGTFCRSDLPGDPLVGIEVQITSRA